MIRRARIALYTFLWEWHLGSLRVHQEHEQTAVKDWQRSLRAQRHAEAQLERFKTKILTLRGI